MTNTSASAPVQRVTVTDVDIPIVSMVVLMLKWAIAAIPAVFILVVAGVVASASAAFLLQGVTLFNALNRPGERATQSQPYAPSSTQTSAYATDLARWRAACSSVPASDARFRACQSDKVSLQMRAAALGTEAP